jgi:hypothetical protein
VIVAARPANTLWTSAVKAQLCGQVLNKDPVFHRPDDRRRLVVFCSPGLPDCRPQTLGEDKPLIRKEKTSLSTAAGALYYNCQVEIYKDRMNNSPEDFSTTAPAAALQGV